MGATYGDFVSDEICDRFCVIGSTARIAEKLSELKLIGVDVFNIYLMTGEQETTLEAYGWQIISAVAP